MTVGIPVLYKKMLKKIPLRIAETLGLHCGYVLLFTFSPYLRHNMFLTGIFKETLFRGLIKFFKTLAKLASSLVFLLAKSENSWPKI
jgi:hypothetical protein